MDPAFSHFHKINGGRYRVEKMIGKGGFGEVYKVFSKTGEVFAMKTETVRCPIPLLCTENCIYGILAGEKGIPKIDFFAREEGNTVMVMQLLGPSLEKLVCSCTGHRFSLKTSLMVMIQMLNRLEVLHSKDYIHRDVKPDNFLMGRGSKEGIVHMIDLGLCKPFRNSLHEHIPFEQHCGTFGTARYMSIHSHRGEQLSRRDDLEGLGYVMVYLMTGHVPWMTVRAPTPQQLSMEISRMKDMIPLEQLCRGMPPEFVRYFRRVKALHFDEKPDYEFLRGLFTDLIDDLGICIDWVYDWTPRSGRAGSRGRSADKRDGGRSRRRKSVR